MTLLLAIIVAMYVYSNAKRRGESAIKPVLGVFAWYFGVYFLLGILVFPLLYSSFGLEHFTLGVRTIELGLMGIELVSIGIVSYILLQSR